jgi:hypothetical protein
MSDLGKGNGGGNFEYGSGGHEVKIVPAAEGVHEGTTEAQRWVESWDAHGPDGGSMSPVRSEGSVTMS